MTNPRAENFSASPESASLPTNLSSLQLYTECRFDSSSNQRSSRQLQDAGILPALDLWVDSKLQSSGSTGLKGRIEYSAGSGCGNGGTGCGDGGAGDGKGGTGDGKGDSGDGKGDTGSGTAPSEEQLRTLFDQMDLNKKGSLSKSEITQATVSQLLKFDGNDDGAVDLKEAMAASKAATGSELVGALGVALADKDKDGKLNYDEMQKVGEELADALLKKGDSDSDGKINFEEFGKLFGQGECPEPPKDPEEPPKDPEEPPKDPEEPPKDPEEPPKDPEEPPKDPEEPPKDPEEPPKDPEEPPKDPEEPPKDPEEPPKDPEEPPKDPEEPPKDPEEPPKDPCDALKDLFDQLDLNKKGSLTEAEITQGTVSQLLKFDSDDDGTISLEEAMTASKDAFGSELIGAFAHTYADANHDGKIDSEEMQKIGKQISGFLMKLGDKDKDGKLAFDEFGGIFGQSGCKPKG